jgi:hypothetical protein
MKCPDCRSADTRRSRRFKWADLFHWLQWQTAWRCRKCHTRFYSRVSQSKAPPNERSKPHKHHSHRSGNLLSRIPIRRRMEAGVFVVMLILFYLFLRFITSERAPAGEGDNRIARSATVNV